MQTALLSLHTHSKQPKPSQTYMQQTVNYLQSNYLALRANPFPEVTDLICRLPLPTLFYYLEAIHLGDLMRLLVRIQLNKHSFRFSRTFVPAPEFAKIANLYQTLMLIANWVYSKHSMFVNKKRELFPGETKMSQNELSLPILLSYSSGILTWFPFDERSHWSIKKL